MDSSAHRTPSSLPLDQLIAHALSELDKINYSRRSVRRYRTVWGHLVTFSRERSLGDRYSEQLTTEFVIAYRRQPFLSDRQVLAGTCGDSVPGQTARWPALAAPHPGDATANRAAENDAPRASLLAHFTADVMHLRRVPVESTVCRDFRSPEHAIWFVH